MTNKLGDVYCPHNYVDKLFPSEWDDKILNSFHQSIYEDIYFRTFLLRIVEIGDLMMEFYTNE